jgi:hypothetical protein
MSAEDKIRAKIKELEFEYARTQKNKATESHLGEEDAYPHENDRTLTIMRSSQVY